MTREESKRERADFNDALATAIESHITNGSAFIFQNAYNEDASDEVIRLRKQILMGVVRTLRFRGKRSL